MSDPSTIIPNFRVHTAISQVNDEILVSPMSKWALSTYPEQDAGYAWGDFEPVSVIPFTSSPELLGKLVKSTIQISLFHYRAPGAKTLLKKREERRKFLVDKFGKANSRFYHPPSFAFVASTASDYGFFLEEYNHILVEDDGETNLRFIVSPLIGKSDLQPIQKQFPINSAEEKLGQAILYLCKF